MGPLSMCLKRIGFNNMRSEYFTVGFPVNLGMVERMAPMASDNFIESFTECEITDNHRKIYRLNVFFLYIMLLYNLILTYGRVRLRFDWMIFASILSCCTSLRLGRFQKCQQASLKIWKCVTELKAK